MFVGSELSVIALPGGPSYEKSLSEQYCYVHLEKKNCGLTFLRHEDGNDVWWISLFDIELYVGRAFSLMRN